MICPSSFIANHLSLVLSTRLLKRMESLSRSGGGPSRLSCPLGVQGRDHEQVVMIVDSC
jgi:hypothetical protein